MKMQLFLVALLAGSCAVSATQGDRTITRVVKLLQQMQQDSIDDGDKEKVLFAKYQCYCDHNTEKFTKNIASMNNELRTLSSDLEKNQGENGELASEIAQLQGAIGQNREEQASATSIRNLEHTSFVSARDEMVSAMDQMDKGFEILRSMGADVPMSDDAANKKFMAGQSSALLQQKEQVKSVFAAISVFLNQEQRSQLNSFMQSSAQGHPVKVESGALLGVLRQMKMNFEENLQGMQDAENSQQKAFDAFMEDKKTSSFTMRNALEKKQEKQGTLDDIIADLKESIDNLNSNVASDTESLETLTAACKVKTSEYEQRKQLRSQEESAVAEAISILNSDDAFQSFGKVDATTSGDVRSYDFLQTAAKQVPVQSHDSLANKVQDVLKSANSQRLNKIVALLSKAENPFGIIFQEVDKMQKLIGEEGLNDEQNKKWCDGERQEQGQQKSNAHDEINALSADVQALTYRKENAFDGIELLIQQTENTIEQIRSNRASVTEDRQSANAAYQLDIKHLVDAQEILAGASAVLKKYYEKVMVEGQEGSGESEKDREQPETWSDNFSGQSDNGNAVVRMLSVVMDNTKKEEDAAHSAEAKAQSAYEDTMLQLKADEEKNMRLLAQYNDDLAETKENIGGKSSELAKVKKQHASITAYLAEIKPGCDFITANLADRNRKRDVESDALNQAVKLMKESPAYKVYLAEAHEEAKGQCAGICGDEEALQCKACMEGVTVAVYCQNNANAQGCGGESEEEAAKILYAHMGATSTE